MKLIHVFTAPQTAYFFMNGQLDFMISKGIEVTVIMPLDIEFNQKFKERQLNVTIINVNFERTISLTRDLSCLFQLIKIFNKRKPDIIHLHTPKASLLGALAARLLFKKNIIYQMHGLVSASGNNVHKGFSYMFERITCSLSTQIFAVSESLKEFAIEYKFCKPIKISVIENGTINGVDFKSQFNPRNISSTSFELEKLSANKFVIGFVGRILNDKGIEDYLFTVSKCKEKNLPVVGFVIGPDESRGELNTLLEKYNLTQDEDICLFGQQFEPEKFMIHFDILLLPTKREGFGLVGAEANALKIPVVGYDIPGFRDAVVNKKTGLLVDFENTDKLLEAVLFYFNNPLLKNEHGENGRKRVVRDFEPKLIWESFFDEYKKCLR
jgi:glycosyltransferase involved in cell wall biosynthesis